MKLTREAALDYLRDPEQFHCVLKVQYATVVSKSYGNEKRFFVPAPIISMIGEGWKSKRKQLHQYYKQKARELRIDEMLVPSPILIGSIGLHTITDHPTLDFSFVDSAPQIAKTLYIRHTESRNFINLALDINYTTGLHLGSFTSDRIKVISKASKAKNFTKSPEFKYTGISNGQTVCLSNRPKIPPITSFIVSDKEKFYTSTALWSPLTVFKVDVAKSPADEESFCTKDGPIHYGDVVRIVCTATGMSFPRLKVCKVEKEKVIIPDDEVPEEDREVLNQMQKIVLQMADDNGFTYICLEDGTVTMKTERIASTRKPFAVNELALFTICCTHELEYKFYEAMGPTFHNVLPAPICSSISIDGIDTQLPTSAHNIGNYIMGSNFSTDLCVWIGSIKCDTTFKSVEMIEFDVPLLQKVIDDQGLHDYYKNESRKFEVPILLVRDDGVIFPTGMVFNYQNVKLPQ